MAQQEKLSSEINQLWDIYRKCMPDVAHAYDELPMEVFKNGVLSGKIKRLMAVVGALVPAVGLAYFSKLRKHYHWVPQQKRFLKPVL